MVIVAALNTTMAYQVGVNPLSRIWQETSKKDG